MRAYDISGRRLAGGVNQATLAVRMDWHIATLRDVEQGRVDISDSEYQRLSSTLDTMIAEVAESKKTNKRMEVAV